MADNSISFLDVCKDVTKTATKIPTTDYLPIGKYKIFDQGKDYIGGFRDSAIGLASDVPYILFGDHTRIIKYIDEPCFIGADGVKLLKVKDSRYTSKYIYYAMKAQPIESQGYARHFKFLKEQFYKYTTIEKQKRIVAELDNIEEGIRVKQEQLKALDELIQSRFTEMFENHNFPLVYPNEIAETIIVGGDKPSQTSPIKDTQYKYAIYSNGEKNLGLIGFSTSARVTKTAITVSARGTIGLAVIRKEPFTPIVRLITLIPNNKVNAIYLTFYLNREREKGLGTSIKQLTLPMFSKKRILLPPLPLQNQFAEFVQQVEKAKEIVKIQIKDLQELLALKMDEYFR